MTWSSFTGHSGNKGAGSRLPNSGFSHGRLAGFAARLVAGLLFVSGGVALAQTTLLFEGFEGIFPGTWAIGDSNATSGLVYWKDVNNSIGSVTAHTGGWKGYCAGYTNGVAIPSNPNPQYANDMQAYMAMRSISPDTRARTSTFG